VGCFGGTQTLHEQNLISLFPNPTSDVLNISMNKEIRSGTLIIMDLNGRIINTSSLNSVTATSIVSIDLSYFTSGTYIVQLITPDADELRKFVIQH
jgi:hypothetical protein